MTYYYNKNKKINKQAKIIIPSVCVLVAFLIFVNNSIPNSYGASPDKSIKVGKMTFLYSPDFWVIKRVNSTDITLIAKNPTVDTNDVMQIRYVKGVGNSSTTATDLQPSMEYLIKNDPGGKDFRWLKNRSTVTTMGTEQALKLESRANAEKDGFLFATRSMTTWTVKDGDLYFFSWVTLPPSQYNQRLPMVEKMISSVKFP